MKQNDAVIQDFTQGPLFKRMLLFSIPFMLSNAMQVLYSMADMLIVGKFTGSHGISAVMVASQAVFFETMVGMGFATGGQVMISQLIGQGKREKLNTAIGTMFSMNLLLGLGMTVLVLCFASPFLKILETPDEAFEGAYSYLLICGGGITFIFGYNMVAAVLRGVGDSIRPFRFILISAVLNILLDLLFVAVFRWGVTGAAVATVISQLAALLLSVQYLYAHKQDFGFDFRPASWRMDRTVLRALVKLGIPFATRFAAINISMLFVLALINGTGVAASAAFGVGMRLDELANKISQGVMMAVSTIVGQNIGASQFDRVRRGVYYAWAICGGFFIVFGALFLIFPKELFRIFTEDPAVLDLAPVILSALLLHYPALLIMKGTNGFLQGIGDAKFGLVIAILDGFVFRISFSWIFGIWLGWGLYGMILGYALATYGTAIPNLFYFLFVPWHKRKTVI